jgi:UDP-glucose 4-epimerase
MSGAPPGRETVVVTGGAGFIGSELVEQLAARGRRVVAIDNLVNGHRRNLQGVLSETVTLRECDIRDLAAWADVLPETACVYHLACLGVRHSLHSPFENHDVNATATLRVLAACRDAGVPRFVYVSSSEIYGTATWVPMTEEHPAFPHTVYGASKLAGECYTRAYHDSYGYATVVVRPFNTYGPRSHHEGDSGEVIPKFMLRCLAGRPLVVFGNGEQTRDFSYVSDTAAGIIAAGESDAATGQTINLGFGAEVSINTLAGVVQDVVGRSAPVEHHADRPGDVRRLYADMGKARALLGYEPRVSLEDGLRRLLDWYRAQPSSPEELLEHDLVENWVPAPSDPTLRAPVRLPSSQA